MPQEACLIQRLRTSLKARSFSPRSSKIVLICAAIGISGIDDDGYLLPDAWVC